MERHRILFKYDGTQGLLSLLKFYNNFFFWKLVFIILLLPLLSRCSDDESIVMAFAKKAVDQRKEWLTSHMEECKRRKELGLQEQYLYTKTTKTVTYAEFINLELVLFSNADNVRSIPSAVDGLKPG